MEQRPQKKNERERERRKKGPLNKRRDMIYIICQLGPRFFIRKISVPKYKSEQAQMFNYRTITWDTVWTNEWS